MQLFLRPVPWPVAACAYTDKELRTLAEEAAKKNRGRLLDYRIVIHANGVQLETRYLLKDGITRHHHTAL